MNEVENGEGRIVIFQRERFAVLLSVKFPAVLLNSLAQTLILTFLTQSHDGCINGARDMRERITLFKRQSCRKK